MSSGSNGWNRLCTGTSWAVDIFFFPYTSCAFSSCVAEDRWSVSSVLGFCSLVGFDSDVGLSWEDPNNGFPLIGPLKLGLERESTSSLSAPKVSTQAHIWIKAHKWAEAQNRRNTSTVFCNTAGESTWSVREEEDVYSSAGPGAQSKQALST